MTLREELDFLERYLAIEKTRFGDRLSTRFRIRSDVLDARVPNLLLQPLVENAIRHGIARDADAGRLEVSATHEGGRLLLRVADDGPGLGPAPVVEGIGLTNTRERLRHLFGDDFSLSYANRRRRRVRDRARVPARRRAAGRRGRRGRGAGRVRLLAARSSRARAPPSRAARPRSPLP